MGYYTNFNLIASKYCDNQMTNNNSLKISENVLNEIRSELEKVNVFEYIDINQASGSINAYCFEKWYDCEADMCLVSRRCPGVLFSIHAEGENNEDIWEEHFLNGKCQRCYAKITFDEFDPELLVDGMKISDNPKYSYEC